MSADSQKTVRRIVVGKGDDGTSIVVADGPAPVMHDLGSMEVTEIWGTDGAVTHDTSDPTPARTEIDLDLANGTTRFRVVEFPAGKTDEPMMHATPTVDYLVVLDGGLRMHLDTGETIDVGVGDTVVLLGNVHAWEPIGGASCRMAFVNVGAGVGSAS
jgi:hypothetical protein